MKKYLLTLITLLALGIAPSYAQKVAYVHEDSVLVSLPEFKTQQKNLESYAKQFQTQIESKQQQLQQEYTFIVQNQNNIPPATLNEKQKLMQELQAEISELQQRAQSSLARKESEMMGPLVDKLKVAIEQIAVAEGYNVVIGADLVNKNGGFLIPVGGTDITEKVIASLSN